VRENLFYAVHANDLLANTTTSSEVLDERLHAVAEISQIESFLKDLPHGYETLLDEKGYSLSGGQRQRLCTARALCRFPRLSSSPSSTPPSSPLSPSSSSPLSSLSRSGHVEKREKFEASPTPRLFLMDEGTSAVDVLTEEKIFTRLKHALRGYTSLLITHRLSALDFASHIAVMDEGRLIQSGKKEEVLAQPSQHLQHILVCSSRPLDISTDSQQTYSSSSTSGSIIHPSPSILGNGEGLPVSTSPSSS
ncbi:abc transporter transmembrane region domain-containing protein, partial [Cystoisospora suis]